jgi:hypothetical protein
MNNTLRDSSAVKLFLFAVLFAANALFLTVPEASARRVSKNCWQSGPPGGCVCDISSYNECSSSHECYHKYPDECY